MPCLNQIFVHDENGNPLLWRTFSGEASLISPTIPLLDDLVARKGKDWLAGRLVVIDREGNAVGLFKPYDASGQGGGAAHQPGEADRQVARR
jgi:hypothetical protein